jgi:hypothetical protein
LPIRRPPPFPPSPPGGPHPRSLSSPSPLLSHAAAKKPGCARHAAHASGRPARRSPEPPAPQAIGAIPRPAPTVTSCPATAPGARLGREAADARGATHASVLYVNGASLRPLLPSPTLFSNENDSMNGLEDLDRPFLSLRRPLPSPPSLYKRAVEPFYLSIPKLALQAISSSSP